MPKKRKAAKQFTLDKLPDIQPKNALEIIKQPEEETISITQAETIIKADELTLKISFKLPKKKAFSRVKSDLWFDNQPINSTLIKLLQGPLATKESEYSTVFDMKGIANGTHKIALELYGLWGPDEKLCRAQKDITINYIPQLPQSKLVKVPSVKSVSGADIAIISELEKHFYLDMQKIAKKENQSKRDEW
jgi:hypothetical protein